MKKLLDINGAQHLVDKMKEYVDFKTPTIFHNFLKSTDNTAVELNQSFYRKPGGGLYYPHSRTSDTYSINLNQNKVITKSIDYLLSDLNSGDMTPFNSIELNSQFDSKSQYDIRLGGYWNISAPIDSPIVFNLKRPYPTTVVLRVANHFEVNKKTGTIADDYPGYELFLTGNNDSINRSCLLGSIQKDDESDNVYILTISANDPNGILNFSLISPRGSTGRFTLFSVELEYENVSYVWNELADKKDVDVIGDIQLETISVIEEHDEDIDILKSTVRQIDQKIEDEIDQLGDKLIYSKEPARNAKNLNKLYLNNNQLNQLQAVGGNREYIADCRNIGTTQEIKSNNKQLIENLFPDSIISVTDIKTVFGSILRIGSSNNPGYVILRNDGSQTIDKIQIKATTYNNQSESSVLYIEHEDQSYSFNIIDRLTIFTLEELEIQSGETFKIGSSKNYGGLTGTKPRFQIEEITLSSGSTVYTWKPLTDPRTDVIQNDVEQLKTNLKVLRNESIYFYKVNGDRIYSDLESVPECTVDDITNNVAVYIENDPDEVYIYKAGYIHGYPWWIKGGNDTYAMIGGGMLFNKGTQIENPDDGLLYISLNEFADEKNKVYVYSEETGFIVLTDDNGNLVDGSQFLALTNRLNNIQNLLEGEYEGRLDNVENTLNNHRDLINSKADEEHIHFIDDVVDLLTTLDYKASVSDIDDMYVFYDELEDNVEENKNHIDQLTLRLTDFNRELEKLKIQTIVVNGVETDIMRFKEPVGTIDSLSSISQSEYNPIKDNIYIYTVDGLYYKYQVGKGIKGGKLGALRYIPTLVTDGFFILTPTTWGSCSVTVIENGNLSEFSPDEILSDSVFYLSETTGLLWKWNSVTNTLDPVTEDVVVDQSIGDLTQAIADLLRADNILEDRISELEENTSSSETVTLLFVVPILWADLKALRDGNDLTPGVWYRITDYQCTTSQADTRTAGHQFDILVLAVDDHTLNENARAARHAGDTYFADCNLDAWELKYCLDNDTQRFAWADTRETEEIIGYSISCGVYGDEYFVRQPENDKEINGEMHYCWYCEMQDYTLYLPDEFTNSNDVYCYDGYEISTNEDFHTISLPAARGVIYHLKDEWGNSCPYDFKNILFKRYSVENRGYDEQLGEVREYENLADLDGKYLGFVGEMQGLTINEWDFVWCYTFTQVGANRDWEDNDWQNLQDASLQHGINDVENVGYHSQFRCLKNIIEMCENTSVIDDEIIEIKKVLNNIVLFSYNKYITKFGDNAIPENDFDFTYNNHFDMSCQNITISGNGNNFGQRCYQIISYFNFISNTFGNYCYSNTFGNYCYSNTFGNYCYSNTFGDYCNSNTFGNNCYSNTFGYDCYFNTFGDNCYSNTFGNECYFNTFGKSAENTELTSRVFYCKIGDNVRYFDLMGDSTATSKYITNVEVQSNLQGTDDNHKVFEFEMVQWEYMANHKKTIIKSAEEDIIEL